MVGSTITQRRRSGIHRVTLEIARALASVAPLDLVRWDRLEGRLRFVDAAELDALFGPGAWPAGVRVRPDARRVGRPFFERIEDLETTWLLAPEVAWHETDGSEILARVLTGCRERGVRTACIFYDLIPITNPGYTDYAAVHEAYVNELLRSDLIVPISRHSAERLSEFWAGRAIGPVPPIHPLLLPDGGFMRPKAPGPGQTTPVKAAPTIALFGTVEPRKRQVEFLRAMAAARVRSRQAALRQVVVIGSLHPAVANDFNALLARHPWITYLDYADDRQMQSVVGAADFTAFLSDDEGYGLPISESLALGAPCLCADFGSMAEVAAGGGCWSVDVRDVAAVEAAIIRLCEEPNLLARLREEIAGRRFQGWTDYSRRLLAVLQEAPRVAPEAKVEGWALPEGDLGGLDEPGFAALAQADVLACPDPASRSALVGEAARRHWPALLPGRMPVGSGQPERLALVGERAERERIATIERAYAAGRAALPAAVAPRPIFLRLLISTFNRRDFVVANVRWLLKEVIGADLGDVDVVVVDGGSSDGTLRALGEISDPRLRVQACPVNVGMLAGLREASRELGAEYVWIVGDDDFIRPEGFRAMLAGLRAHAGAPLAFMNFSVYHRTALRTGETAIDLIAEAVPVAKAVAADGLLLVREAAEQTDNLFTAIYAIVWRADVLATAFDHAFDGSPFSDLVQAVPCTDLILRRFADCDSVWRGEPTVAGNAHNSWSRWRPRWHGVVMPMAFTLARDAGVDPVRLQTWADAHLDLLREALEIARSKGEDNHLTPAQLELAEIVYRLDVATEIAR